MPKRPTSRERHGHREVDDYAWFRDVSRTDADVMSHLDAENAYVGEVLGHIEGLRDELFEEIKGRIKETDLSVPSHLHGHWYYSRSIEGLQYPVFCRVPARPGETDPPDPDAAEVSGREQVLVDGNLEAGDGDYFALGILDLAPDRMLLAWGCDRNGSEQYTIRFRDLATGEDRDDEIVGAYYSSAWSADGRHFFYTRPDEAMRPHEVWRHELGTPASDDVLVHREPDERFFCAVGASKDREWIVLSMGSKITDEIRVARADDIEAGFRVVVPRRQGIEADLDHVAGTFYVLTNDDAVDFRIVAIPAGLDEADPVRWVDAVPHQPGVRLEGLDVLRDHLVVEERTEATTRLRVRRLSSADEFVVDQPEEVSTVHLAGNDDMDWPQLRFTYTSLVTPATVIDLDLDTGDRHVRKVQPVLGGYDAAEYVSRRVWAVGTDGTSVPVSVVHRRDREPGGPALLYGYGSYEISIDPTFSSLRLSLLDRGWAFAIGHVRGGGEMGRRWYEDGKLARKVNSFDDLVACGRALSESGLAAADRIAVRGGSAGGLLVGAALNRAPDVWAAVVAEVPFVDALNSILDPSLPLTVIEWEEWGNPVESREIFEVMASYSPYENVPARRLPPVLATAGLHDPRVGYWEPAKWVARLRDVASGGPFLLKTEMGAGHGGPSGRYDAWRDEALVLAFLLDTVGSG
jgi:oligopeptidase B